MTLYLVSVCIFQTTLTFELTYNAPDGSVGMWQRGGFEPIKSDELRGTLTEEERNQLNIDRSSSHDTRSQHSTSITIEGDDDSESVTTSPTKSVRGSKLSIASRTSGGKSPKRSVVL